MRGLLIFLRSVPEIVWALLFVARRRPRPHGRGAGHRHHLQRHARQGLRGNLSSRSTSARPTPCCRPAAVDLAAFAYGILPNAAAELVSYTVYRWECAIRASVVMGFVGAGGLGQQIDLSLRMFAGGEVASMLLTFLRAGAARRPTQPPAALEADMNRLINLVLLLSHRARRSSLHSSIWASTWRTACQRRS